MLEEALLRLLLIKVAVVVAAAVAMVFWTVWEVDGWLQLLLLSWEVFDIIVIIFVPFFIAFLAIYDANVVGNILKVAFKSKILLPFV